MYARGPVGRAELARGTSCMRIQGIYQSAFSLRGLESRLIKGVMCTWKGMQLLHSFTCAHIGYIGSVVTLLCRPMSLLSQ